MSDNPRIGDEGTEIVITIVDNGLPVNLSNALKLLMVFRKPNNQVIHLNAEMDGVGTDGRIKVVTGRGAGELELDKAGKWEVEGKAEVVAGRWTTAKGNLLVENVIRKWEDLE
jgi:hypothetical protein